MLTSSHMGRLSLSCKRSILAKARRWKGSNTGCGLHTKNSGNYHGQWNNMRSSESSWHASHTYTESPPWYKENQHERHIWHGESVYNCSVFDKWKCHYYFHSTPHHFLAQVSPLHTMKDALALQGMEQGTQNHKARTTRRLEG